MKTYCIDIDGTICTISVNDYSSAEPYTDRIEQLNCLYDEGNRLIYFTARGSLSGLNHEELTKKQLKEWGVKYHEILFGKPAADYYIDDKATDIFLWFEN
jgi:hypothetical protein